MRGQVPASAGHLLVVVGFEPDGEQVWDRARTVGYPYRKVAENIAAGQRTPQDVVTSWMNSSGHRANILNCNLTEIGVGYATGGSYGRYWTQNFGGL